MPFLRRQIANEQHITTERHLQAQPGRAFVKVATTPKTMKGMPLASSDNYINIQPYCPGCMSESRTWFVTIGRGA